MRQRRETIKSDAWAQIDINSPFSWLIRIFLCGRDVLMGGLLLLGVV
jgi:hypothetical protein